MRSLITPFILFLISSLLYLSCKKDPGSDPVPADHPITGMLTVTGVPGSSASFDAGSATYTITVPAGTDVKALRLAVPLVEGATISPDPATARDYTNPLKYTITVNGKTQQITVKVVVSASDKSSAKLITTFRFAALNVDGEIDQNNRKITVKVPATEDITKLTPAITVSDKASVSPASGAQQNFTNPVSYTVTAEDGSTQVYEVKVEKQTVGGGKACLLTRIDFFNRQDDTPTHITFEYDQEGRVSRIVHHYTSKGDVISEFSYNQNGEILSFKSTLWADGLGEIRFVYEGGKITKGQYYDGVLGVLSEEVKINEFWGSMKLDELNRVVGFDNDDVKFEYKNDVISKIYYYNDDTGVWDELEVYYDDKNHFLAGSKPKGLTNAFYWWIRVVDSSVPSFIHNITGSSREKDAISYKYNSNDYPIEMTFTAVNSPVLRFTYANCN